MSILEQVLHLGAQLTDAERQQVIDAWTTADDDAPVELDDATKRLLDEALARLDRGEGTRYSLEEAMAILHSRRQP